MGAPQPGVDLHGFPVSLSAEGVDHRARRRESRCTLPGKTSRICPAAHFCLFCVMTPYYSEEIVYSRNDLDLEKEDSVSVIFYLQKIFPDEWNNFMERINCKRETKVWGNEENVLQLRHCASLRGQTLSNSARCVAICLMLLLLVISLREASVGPAGHRCEEGDHR